jgi:hypothetical protein
MNIPNHAQIKELMEHEEPICLSLFMPLHHARAETYHDSILLKNLLHQSRELLLAQNMPPGNVNDFIAPIEKLLKEDVRLHPGEGTAIFATKDYHQHYLLPQKTTTEVMVAPHFYIRPLLPFMHFNGRGHFYVLAISQHQIRLLECSPFDAREVQLPADMPKNIGEALQEDDKEKDVHLHSIRSGASARGMFHGHGTEMDIRKDSVLRYLRIVDKWMHSILQHKNNPLLIAAVDYLIPIYREVNSYPYLFPEGIIGNPDRAKAEELRDNGWALVKPKFMEKRQKDIDRYHNLSATNSTSFRVEEIVPYATKGLVDVLFVAEEEKCWGWYNDGDIVEVHEQKEKFDQELLNYAVEKTIASRGTVYSLSKRDMPKNVSLAAIFRTRF